MNDHQFKIVYGVLIREYDRFKKYFPGEEPFWKISCVRKYFRPKFSESDLKTNWRSITTSRGQTEITEIEEVSLTKIRKTGKVITEQKRVKVIRESDEKIISDKPLTRREKYLEIHEEELIQETYKSMDNNFMIDTNVHLNDPNFIDIIQLEENQKICDEKVLGLWGKINVQDKLIITKDKSFMEVDSMMSKIEEAYSKSLQIMMDQEKRVKELVDENQQLKKQLSEHKLIDIKELTHIKSDWSMQEIINKYVDNQKKLTTLKNGVIKILEKHDRLNIHRIIREKGFILSFIDTIKYFDDEYDEDDHLSDFD